MSICQSCSLNVTPTCILYCHMCKGWWSVCVLSWYCSFFTAVWSSHSLHQFVSKHRPIMLELWQSFHDIRIYRHVHICVCACVRACMWCLPCVLTSTYLTRCTSSAVAASVCVCAVRCLCAAVCDMLPSQLQLYAVMHICVGAVALSLSQTLSL